MGQDIRNYVQQCQYCQNILTHCHKPYGLLEPLPVPVHPLDWVSMDFITGLLLSKWCRQVYNTVLVVVDMFTKYCWYCSCTKDITVDELVDLFYDDFICSKGTPANIMLCVRHMRCGCLTVRYYVYWFLSMMSICSS